MRTAESGQIICAYGISRKSPSAPAQDNILRRSSQREQASERDTPRASTRPTSISFPLPTAGTWHIHATMCLSSCCSRKARCEGRHGQTAASLVADRIHGKTAAMDNSSMRNGAPKGDLGLKAKGSQDAILEYLGTKGSAFGCH